MNHRQVTLGLKILIAGFVLLPFDLLAQQVRRCLVWLAHVYSPFLVVTRSCAHSDTETSAATAEPPLKRCALREFRRDMPSLVL